MKEQKAQAFTLIELLAVLVILAIIALIIFPIIGDVIADSKMKAFKSSVDGLEHAVDLDYQKDYYKGEREYSYEDGNLTLDSVKGESKNNNIKVEGIIENGVGTVSVDKDGNTSLMIYNDEYCAVKDYEDKTITIEEKTDTNCKGPTQAYCFETEETIILESYDINLENCKAAFGSDSSYSESDKTAFCTKGQTASDGHSFEKDINEYANLELINQLVNDKIIENAVPVEGLSITDYKCYAGNTYSYETITNVLIPTRINDQLVLNIGEAAFYDKGLTSVVLSKTINTIEETAFSFNNLTSVHIPKKVKVIGRGAFSCNYSLEEENVTYEDPNNLPIIGENAFSYSGAGVCV